MIAHIRHNSVMCSKLGVTCFVPHLTVFSNCNCDSNSMLLDVSYHHSTSLLLYLCLQCLSIPSWWVSDVFSACRMFLLHRTCVCVSLHNSECGLPCRCVLCQPHTAALGMAHCQLSSPTSGPPQSPVKPQPWQAVMPLPLPLPLEGLPQLPCQHQP